MSGEASVLAGLDRDGVGPIVARRASRDRLAVAVDIETPLSGAGQLARGDELAFDLDDVERRATARTVFRRVFGAAMIRTLAAFGFVALSSTSVEAREPPWVMVGDRAIVDALPEGLVDVSARPMTSQELDISIALPIVERRLPSSLRALIGQEMAVVDYQGHVKCTRRVEGFGAETVIIQNRSAREYGLAFSGIDWNAPVVDKTSVGEYRERSPTTALTRSLFYQYHPRLVAKLGPGCDGGAFLARPSALPVVATKTGEAVGVADLERVHKWVRGSSLWGAIQAQYLASRRAEREIRSRHGEDSAAGTDSWDTVWHENDAPLGAVWSAPGGQRLLVVSLGNGFSCRVGRVWFAFDVSAGRFAFWSWGVGEAPEAIINLDGMLAVDDGSAIIAPRRTTAEPYVVRYGLTNSLKFGGVQPPVGGCIWSEQTFGAW